MSKATPGRGIAPLSARGVGGLVVYQSDGNGTLSGVWIDNTGTKTGTEIAEGGQAGSLIGTYFVTIFDSAHTVDFLGTLSIEQDGSGYSLKWFSQAGVLSFQGIGLDAGQKMLAATWNAVHSASKSAATAG